MNEAEVFFVRWAAESELKAIADRLLGLISEDSEEAPSLNSAAVVFLSAVLEALSIYAIDLLAAHEFQDSNYAEAANALRKVSIRDRLMLLPIAATKSAFVLNLGSESVQSLFSLVARRNDIVHIKPKAHLISSSPSEEELSRPVVSNRLLGLLRGPSVDELRRYREAIEQFELQFVSRIGSGDYQSGDILTDCRYSPGAKDQDERTPNPTTPADA